MTMNNKAVAVAGLALLGAVAVSDEAAAQRGGVGTPTTGPSCTGACTGGNNGDTFNITQGGVTQRFTYVAAPSMAAVGHDCVGQIGLSFGSGFSGLPLAAGVAFPVVLDRVCESLEVRSALSNPNCTIAEVGAEVNARSDDPRKANRWANALAAVRQEYGRVCQPQAQRTASSCQWQYYKVTNQQTGRAQWARTRVCQPN